MTFEIERGVQIPVVSGRSGQRVQYPFASMSIGDSFFVPCESDKKALASLRSRILHAASVHRDDQQADFAATTRIVEKDGRRGVRVWRVEYREPSGRKRGRPKASAVPPDAIANVASVATVHRIASAEEDKDDAPKRRGRPPAEKPRMAFDIPKFADGGKPRAVKGSRY